MTSENKRQIRVEACIPQSEYLLQSVCFGVGTQHGEVVSAYAMSQQKIAMRASEAEGGGKGGEKGFGPVGESTRFQGQMIHFAGEVPPFMIAPDRDNPSLLQELAAGLDVTVAINDIPDRAESLDSLRSKKLNAALQRDVLAVDIAEDADAFDVWVCHQITSIPRIEGFAVAGLSATPVCCRTPTCLTFGM
jgi:hypothetical protein